MKKDNFELIQKHIFESVDYLLEASVNRIYQSGLKDPNTKMGTLLLTRDSPFFNDFGTYIGANINMQEFWGQNNVYSLTISDFKLLILHKYLGIQKNVQKTVTEKYLSMNVLGKYETLTPATLQALQKLIETQLINR